MKRHIYYDLEHDLFLKERDDGSYRAYFPDHHEEVDLDDVDLTGIIEVKW